MIRKGIGRMEDDTNKASCTNNISHHIRFARHRLCCSWRRWWQTTASLRDNHYYHNPLCRSYCLCCIGNSTKRQHVEVIVLYCLSTMSVHTVLCCAVPPQKFSKINPSSSSSFIPRPRWCSVVSMEEERGRILCLSSEKKWYCVALEWFLYHFWPKRGWCNVGVVGDFSTRETSVVKGKVI